MVVVLLVAPELKWTPRLDRIVEQRAEEAEGFAVLSVIRQGQVDLCLQLSHTQALVLTPAHPAIWSILGMLSFILTQHQRDGICTKRYPVPVQRR